MPESKNIVDKMYAALGVSAQRVSKESIDFSNAMASEKKSSLLKLNKAPEVIRACQRVV